MLEFDEKKVADKFIAEGVFFSRKKALRVARVIKHDLHEKLRPAFLTWINGGIPEFEYEGFTLEGLKILLKGDSYYDTFNHMDSILKDPKEQIPLHRDPIYLMTRRMCSIDF